MELALRRSYGYAFAPPLNRGIRGLGDCGDGTDPVYDLTCANTVAPIESPVGTTLTPTSTYSGAPISIVDSSGNSWSCDGNGNCCDANGTCQQGPPTILTSTPPNATVQQSASSSAANQSAAQLVAALATAAAAVGKSVVGTPGSIQCSSGVAVAAGQKCPGAVGTSVCPTGSTLSGSTCVPGGLIAGVSNTTLAIAAVVIFALMAMGGKRR